MTHALDGIVVKLTVGCPYLFDFADFEDLTQRAKQFFGIVRVDVHGFVVSPDSEVRNGEVVLASDVDGGSPFGVRGDYAFLVIRCFIRYPTASLYSGGSQHPF